MKIDESIYYTPHQMASFFSISRDTLLFYDRIGLFTPAMRKSNGYRLYSASQVNELDTILTLKDLGIPLAAIKEAVASINTPSFLSLLENEEASIMGKIRECNARLGIVKAIRSSINEAMAAEKGKLYKAHLKKTPYIEMPIRKIGKTETSDTAWQEAYSRLIAKAGCRTMITTGSIVTMEDARNTLGSICRKVYATVPGPAETYIPAGEYAYMFFKGTLSSLNEFYAEFLKAIDDEGLTAIGDIYEELTISSIVTKSEDEQITKLFVRVSG